MRLRDWKGSDFKLLFYFATYGTNLAFPIVRPQGEPRERNPEALDAKPRSMEISTEHLRLPWPLGLGSSMVDLGQDSIKCKKCQGSR